MHDPLDDPPPETDTQYVQLVPDAVAVNRVLCDCCSDVSIHLAVRVEQEGCEHVVDIVVDDDTGRKLRDRLIEAFVNPASPSLNGEAAILSDWIDNTLEVES